MKINNLKFNTWQLPFNQARATQLMIYISVLLHAPNVFSLNLALSPKLTPTSSAVVHPATRVVPADETSRKAPATRRSKSNEIEVKLESNPNRIAWNKARFSYEASGRQISEVLRDFGAAQDLPVVISEGVEGIVTGRFNNTPTEFLNAIGKSFGLVWYHDGSTLYIYQASEVKSRIFRLQGFDHRRVQSLTKSLQWGDSRFPLKYSPQEKTLLVSGPPRHIEIVSQAIEILDAEAGERLRQVIEVVPLKFTNAVSTTVNGIPVPGLAETMQKLFDDREEQKESSSDKMTNSMPFAHEGKLAVNQSSTKVLDVLAGKAKQQAESRTSSTTGNPRGLNSPLTITDKPKFIADASSNSIIIYASPLRMSQYVDAIKKLDIEPLQIELEAMILDLSQEQAESLGLSWSLTADNSSQTSNRQFGISGSTPLQVTATWATAGAAIQARLTAMTQDGRAKLVSRPKVVGSVNTPTLLASQRKVSVKVAGNLEAKLYTLDAGTSIQVTPQAYLLGNNYRIRLTLVIEDGDLETGTVDGVPIVRRMQISTDVRLTEGESVVLGGISSDSSLTGNSGVPGLSSVPILGAIFRNTETVQRRSERIFMITPRVVYPSKLNNLLTETPSH